jgi:hypothetical protein
MKLYRSDFGMLPLQILLRLRDDEQTGARNIFQSKNLMFINKMMMESWQKITMVAYMLEQEHFFMLIV